MFAPHTDSRGTRETVKVAYKFTHKNGMFLLYDQLFNVQLIKSLGSVPRFFQPRCLKLLLLSSLFFFVYSSCDVSICIKHHMDMLMESQNVVFKGDGI